MSLHETDQDWQPSDATADLESLAATLALGNAPARKKPVAGFWILLFALLGVVGSVTGFTFEMMQSRQDEQAVWEAQTRNYHDALRQSLTNAQILLFSIRETVTRVRPLTRDGFSSITAELRRFFPGLQIVSWIPRVKIKDIAALEADAADLGNSGFKVRNVDGSLPQATGRPDDDVFPVFYDSIGVGANDANRPVGVNVLSMPGRREILARACSSGDTLASNWPTLMNGASGVGNLVLYLAAYDADLAVTFPYEACPRLIGYLAAVVRPDTLMATAFRSLATLNADIYLLDAGAPESRQRMGVYPGTHPEGSFKPLRPPAVMGAATSKLWLEVGGLELTLAFVPLPRGWHDSTRLAWIMLVCGLVLTAALTAFFSKLRTATLRLTDEATRRHLAERALRASEYRFRLALKDSNVTVFSQDRDLRYTWIYNPTIGIPPKDIIGRRHSDLFPGEAARDLEILKSGVINTGVSCRQDVRFVVKGVTYIRDLRIEPLRDHLGTITGLIAVAVDVTEARRMKDALSRAVAAAERANAAKSRFLAAASHDLRQPFQAMQLYFELLLVRLTDPTSLELGHHLGDSIRTGRELLTALLDVSTLDAGTLTPKIGDFPLRPSLESLLAEFKEQTAKAGISLHLVPTDAHVQSDRVLLERILRNLITNAIRYTPHGRILVGCRRRGGQIEIQIWDTGIGIAADKLELIFEDFYQVGNPERRLTQGLGLGLGIVSRMARLLGHKVTVCSRPSLGSLFSIRVVLAGSAVPAHHPREPETRAALPPQRLLIIEDDDMQRRALRMLLEDGGHTVLSAGTPDEALAALSSAVLPPTVIVSDLRLPGPASGVDVIRRLRQRIGVPVPALLVTGDTDQSQLQLATEAGITILHKPFNHAALLEVLRRILPDQPAACVGDDL